MADVSKRIIFKNPDGSVGVVIPSPNSKLTLKEIAEGAVPKGAPWRIADVADVPSDRYFRNAWRDTSSASHVDIDIPAARDIRLNDLRKVRNEKLAKYDIEVVKALESGDTARLEEVKAHKQALRDMPDNVTLTRLTSPKSIKEYTPDILKVDI